MCVCVCVCVFDCLAILTRIFALSAFSVPICHILRVCVCVCVGVLWYGYYFYRSGVTSCSTVDILRSSVQRGRSRCWVTGGSTTPMSLQSGLFRIWPEAVRHVHPLILLPSQWRFGIWAMVWGAQIHPSRSFSRPEVDDGSALKRRQLAFCGCWSIRVSVGGFRCPRIDLFLACSLPRHPTNGATGANTGHRRLN